MIIMSFTIYGNELTMYFSFERTILSWIFIFCHFAHKPGLDIIIILYIYCGQWPQTEHLYILCIHTMYLCVCVCVYMATFFFFFILIILSFSVCVPTFLFTKPTFWPDSNNAHSIEIWNIHHLHSPIAYTIVYIVHRELAE